MAKYPMTKEGKKFVVVSYIIAAVLILIAVLGMFKATDGNFLEMPLVKMVVGEDGLEEYQDLVDEFEDIIDDSGDEEIELLEEEFGKDVDEIEEIMRTPSINTMIKLAETEALDLDEEDAEPFNIIKTIIIVYMLVVIFFMALALILKNRGVNIAGLIISLPYYILLVNPLFTVLQIVLCIAYFVVLTMAKSANKKAFIQIEE